MDDATESKAIDIMMYALGELEKLGVQAHDSSGCGERINMQDLYFTDWEP